MSLRHDAFLYDSDEVFVAQMRAHLVDGLCAGAHAVAVTYLLPIWGVFWGAVAHEHVGMLTYLGVAVVIAARSAPYFSTSAYGSDAQATRACSG